MSSESTPAPLQQNVAKQVVPIGLNGSGSTTEMGKSLEKQNKELTMQIAQATADEEFDAKVPPRTEPAKYVVSNFTNPEKTEPVAYTIGVIGVLLIVYGLVVE